MARIEVDEDTLRELAGQDAFARGWAQYRDGVVDEVMVHGTQVRAAVGATAPRQVELRVGLGGLTGQCDCPDWSEENFCEHCVATGLAWLDENADPADADDGDALEAEQEAALRAYLIRQDPQWLADELLDALADDPDRFARLLSVATETEPAPTNG